MSKGVDKVTYIIYHNGRTRVVSRETWEKNWIDWWNRFNY
jgi:hypothetical protein